jgi:hypothetical protein
VALRAIACSARGGDPEAETGVAVETLVDPWDDDDGGDDPGLWDHPEELLPIGPEGENADPEAAVRGLMEPDRVGEEEEARFARLQGWLAGEEIPPAELEVDLLNARLWADFLQHDMVPASAVTEFDLRLFVYAYHQENRSEAERTVPALSRSLRRVVRFLEEREGIRYPFAGRVLDELDQIAGDSAEADTPLHEVLDALSFEIFDDLDMRGWVRDLEVAGEPWAWVRGMSEEIAWLENDIQRRWLLWYDEAVRAGATDDDALDEMLVERQREWEATPHPGLEGRTPAEVVRAAVAEVRGKRR